MTARTTNRETLYGYQHANYGVGTRPNAAGILGALCIWALAVTVVVTNLV